MFCCGSTTGAVGERRFRQRAGDRVAVAARSGRLACAERAGMGWAAAAAGRALSTRLVCPAAPRVRARPGRQEVFAHRVTVNTSSTRERQTADDRRGGRIALGVGHGGEIDGEAAWSSMRTGWRR